MTSLYKIILLSLYDVTLIFLTVIRINQKIVSLDTAKTDKQR